MTKDELFDEIHALGVKARDAGHVEIGNELIVMNIVHFADTRPEWTREEIVGYLQPLAAFAMISGLKYAAFNISFIGMAMLLGEKAELDLGIAMMPVAAANKAAFKNSNFFWPDTLD